jgi:Firmicute plasmid replication protein (RepL)
MKIILEGNWMRYTLAWDLKTSDTRLNTKVGLSVIKFIHRHILMNQDVFRGFLASSVAKFTGGKLESVNEILKILIEIDVLKKDQKKPYYFVDPRLLWQGNDGERFSLAVQRWDEGTEMYFDSEKWKYTDKAARKKLGKSQTPQNPHKYPEDPQNPQIAREILEDFYDY